MADTKYIKGGDLMLFQKSGSGYTAFAYAKSHSLQLDADSLEVSSKDSGKWKQFLTTKLSYTINAEHLFTETDYNSLVEKMIAREPKFYLQSLQIPMTRTESPQKVGRLEVVGEVVR